MDTKANQVSSEDLDEQLRRFEASIDKNDPEQIKLLEAMREHTRRLHQARGDWNKPSTFRNWNDPMPRAETTAPLAIESYRDYKNYTLKESQSLQLLARGQEIKQLLAPPPQADK